MLFRSSPLLLLCVLLLTGCAAGLRITDRPISFSDQRIALTEAYITEHYGLAVSGIEMVPRMIVLHWTAIDDTEASFNVFNAETLGNTRPDLQGAGQVNVGIQFLVSPAGEVFRLMRETWVARHVIGLNYSAIGVENVGGANGIDNLTDAQLAANVALVRYLAEKYPTIEYLIGHHEYQLLEGHPLWRELDGGYRTTKTDPGDRFMQAVRNATTDLGLKGPTEILAEKKE